MGFDEVGDLFVCTVSLVCLLFVLGNDFVYGLEEVDSLIRVEDDG